jgi:hypothetical protein
MARYRDIDSNFEMREVALSAAAEIICKSCKEIVLSVPEFTRDFNIRHSMAHELQAWLDAHNMSHVMPILAQHGISSIRMVASLSFSNDVIARIAEELSAASLQSQIQSLANVTLIVQMAKESELSKPPSWRCDRFLDSDASALTAIFSSCAVDIMLTKKYFVLFMLLSGGGVCLLSLFAWISHTFFPESYLTANFWANPMELVVLAVSFISVGVWPLLLGGNYERIPRNRLFKPRHIISCGIAVVVLLQTIVFMLNKSLTFDAFSLFNSMQCRAARDKNWLRTSMNFCVLYELLAVYGLQYSGFILWFICLNFFQNYFLRFFVISSCSMCIVDIVLYKCITVSDDVNQDAFAADLLSNLPLILSVGMACVLIVFEVLRLYSSRIAQRKLKTDTEM